MADENTTPPAAPVVENATPVADTPGVATTPPAAPVVETPSAPAPAEAPKPAETPAEKPADAPATPEPAAAKPSTVLGKTPEAPKVAGEKPAETPAAETPASTDEGGQSADAASLPTYEPYTLPEGLSFDQERLVDFNKQLGEFQVDTKAEQAKVQAFGQKLVERHIAEVQAAITRVAENYSKQWEKQTNDWFESFKNDPEIGGNKFETTQNSVLEAVGKYAGNEAQLTEFKGFMNNTGVGNNPGIIRLIHNMNSEIEGLKKKYESEDGVKPLAATKPVSEKKGFLQGMYGNMK